MRALTFDSKLAVVDVPRPARKKHDVLIRVNTAGICNTDHEILKGYVPGFTGIPGHEFYGFVEEADSPQLLGKRVTAEINCACGTCNFCRQGLSKHCPNRTVLGIVNRSGAFAEYVAVPQSNVIEIPESISDKRAVFIEPLAAACEILRQVTIADEHSVLIIGDGKLASLIAIVLYQTHQNITVVGKHDKKLKLIRQFGIPHTKLLSKFKPSQYDIVIEASGKAQSFELAMHAVKPQGSLVVKSTYPEKLKFNPSKLVVDEIKMVGSRCGHFDDAIKFLLMHNPEIEQLISAEFSLEDAVKAFQCSRESESMKVVLKV